MSKLMRQGKVKPPVFGVAERIVDLISIQYNLVGVCTFVVICYGVKLVGNILNGSDLKRDGF